MVYGTANASRCHRNGLNEDENPKMQLKEGLLYRTNHRVYYESSTLMLTPLDRVEIDTFLHQLP